MHAAVALWRTNGYAKTTVADICRAAGVSRALFYFYFPAKEDVLFEVGVLSTRAARRTVRTLTRGDYDIETVIKGALRSLERSMSRNPPELIVAAVLEGYRQQQHLLSGDRAADPDADMFGELFTTAQRDGKLPAAVDVTHLSRVAHMLVSEGVRHWAATGCTGRLAEPVARDIAALIAGYRSLSTQT